MLRTSSFVAPQAYKSTMPAVAAVICFIFGLIVLSGWLFNLTILKCFFSGLVEVKTNTAICFILMSVALWLVRHPNPRPSPTNVSRALALVTMLIGGITLAEYVLEFTSFIDEALFRESSGAALTTHPNRMAPATAIGFVLSGSALIGLGWRRSTQAAHAIAVLTCALAFLSLSGYLFGLPFFYALFNLTPIAAQTAGTLLVLGLGLYFSRPREGFLKKADDAIERQRFAAALGLLGFIGLGLYLNVARLNDNYRWTTHSQQVISDLNKIYSISQSIETGMRGHIITGDDTYLEPYFNAFRESDGKLEQLLKLTSDNPGQQKLIMQLGSLIEREKKLQQQILDAHATEGISAARRVMNIQKSKDIMEEIQTVYSEILREEQRLFKVRQTDANISSHNAIISMAIGGLVVGAMLVVVFRGLQREVNERKERERALDEQTRLLESIVNNMGEGLVVADQSGKFLIWNPAAARILGKGMTDRPPEEWTNVYGVFMPDGITPVAPECLPLPRALRGESVDDDVQFIRNDQNPNGVWISVSARPLTDHAGRSMGGVAVFRDITESRRIEQQILELNEQLTNRAGLLEAANKELEAFSYSVSHDLRAPLRHINGYVDLLKKGLNGHLDEKHLRRLNVISSSATNMGQLIDDLLVFSRMGRAAMTIYAVDLNQLVAEVRESLSMDLENRTINWRVADLPVIQADRNMLRLVLMNMLGNAIKYTRHRDPAVIEIGSREENGAQIVFVKDNGAGFDMRYVEKMFGVFQRLHSVTEFEGTGIGLANVRRIILRHGGTTWAEGKVNEGATIYFSIPMKKEA